MLKITLQIDGMMCGMCEAHINDALRRAFGVKKVASSRREGKTEIFTDTPLDKDQLQKVIGDTGYTLTGIQTESYEKRSFLPFHRR